MEVVVAIAIALMTSTPETTITAIATVHATCTIGPSIMNAVAGEVGAIASATTGRTAVVVALANWAGVTEPLLQRMDLYVDAGEGQCRSVSEQNYTEK